MEYTREEVNLIVADSFRELGYKQKKLFLASIKFGDQTPEYEQRLIKSCGAGVYNNLRDKFCDESFRSGVLASLRRKGVRCTTFKSASFPESLKHISHPPLVLYMRGNVRLLEQKIFAVVGSRKSTAQAIEECKKMVAELAEHFVIATGIADGVDNAAALGALPSGRVVCVLPCGHGAINPTLKRVEEQGLSLSEFPPDTPTMQYMFTLRNRILAGLSSGVLVVSAGNRSGAFSTAGYAADYGKDVFAFPYGIGVASGEGCNKLIKNGAYLCDCVEDIFSVMGIEQTNADEKNESSLDEDERAVLSALRQEGELHAERLASLTGKKMFELSAICSSLEIKGLVVRTGGNKFAAL